MAKFEKKTDIQKAREAVQSFVDGTAKFHSPPNENDPDVVLSRVINEYEALKGSTLCGTVAMVVTSNPAAVFIYHVDTANGNILKTVKLAGPPALSIHGVRGHLAKMKPDLIVIDPTGIGESYTTFLNDWYNQLKKNNFEEVLG